jgi:ParB-like chromosome segregation protein Spo0J
MCGSIREYGVKIPVLARSDGEVVDGHLRLKAARKLRITEIPLILCDEWTVQQVKAFRLMVNRSVAWAAWDDELRGLELQELNADPCDIPAVLDRGDLAARTPASSPADSASALNRFIARSLRFNSS